MQTALSRIWTWIADSISNDDNFYAKHTSLHVCVYVWIYVCKNKWIFRIYPVNVPSMYKGL